MCSRGERKGREDDVAELCELARRSSKFGRCAMAKRGLFARWRYDTGSKGAGRAVARSVSAFATVEARQYRQTDICGQRDPTQKSQI